MQHDGYWFAEVWLNRNVFSAVGQTEEEAKTNLREFMKSRIMVWEDKVATEEQTLKDITTWLKTQEP